MTTQRTLNRNLIVHNDLEIGYGTVVQERGDVAAAEQKIELMFIFRQLDEIRNLDYNKYTRVGLHQDNAPVVEYWFDFTSAASDDGDDVLAPVPAISLGRWIKIANTAPVYTTAELADISATPNTSVAKQAGYMVWNSNLEKPLWSVGSGNGDVWVDATGSTVHTPS
jgi:hypothetical protein